MIHNMFNEKLLIQCREPQFKGQYMEPISTLNIINEKEKYEVEKIRNHIKQGYNIQFLVYWKRYSNEHN